MVVVVVVTCCSSRRSELPEWMKPGVRVGEDFLVKELFVEDKRLDAGEDIAFGELDPSPGHEVCVVARRCAIFVTSSGEPIRSVRFGRWPDNSAWNPRIVDVEGDGVCEFFDVNSPYGKLFDHFGRRMWTTSPRVMSAITGAYGDTNGDGKLEFVFYDFGGAFSLYDGRGKLIWSIMNSAFDSDSVAMIDIDEDGDMEIVGTNDNRITVLDGDGKLVKQTRSKLNIFLGEAPLAHFPTKDGPQYFLGNGEGTFLLVSLDGDTIIQEFKRDAYLDYKVATPVQLKSDEDPYFAIFGEMWWQGDVRWGLAAIHSLLYVYDSEGNVVYEEVIGDQGRAITAAPSGRSNEEVLLVGCKGKVWRYRIRKPDGAGK